MDDTENKLSNKLKCSKKVMWYSYDQNDGLVGFMCNIKTCITEELLNTEQKELRYDFEVIDMKWSLILNTELLNDSNNGKYINLYIKVGNNQGDLHIISDYSDFSKAKVFAKCISNVEKNQSRTCKFYFDFKSSPSQVDLMLVYINNNVVISEERKYFLNHTEKLEDIIEGQVSIPDYVELKGSDWTLHARIQMLKNASPVFEAMLSHNMKELAEKLIEITDITYESTKAMLGFISTGSLIIKDESIIYELSQAAEKYCIDNLKLICDYELCLNTTEENIAERIITSVSLRYPLSSALNTTFIRNNFITVVNRDDWENIAGHKESIIRITRKMANLGCPSLEKARK